MIKLKAVFLTATAFSVLQLSAFAATEITWDLNQKTINVNGQSKPTEIMPINDGTDYLIPLRAFVDMVKGNIEWADVEGEVFFTIPNNRVLCWPGYRVAQTTFSADTLAPRTEVWVEKAPVIINETTYVTTEFLKNNLGCDTVIGENKITVTYDSSLTRDELLSLQPKVETTPQPTMSPEETKIEKIGGDGFDYKLLFESPEGWYSSNEAIEAAYKYIDFQKSNGGWEKNTDMLNITQLERQTAIASKCDNKASLDNGATVTQIKFLSKVYEKTHDEKIAESIYNGISFIVSVQYDNGGFPQSAPATRRLPYHSYITFNDNSTANVMGVLRDIGYGRGAYAALPEETITLAKDSYDRGIRCILDLQIVSEGVKTAWAQQYEPNKLVPAKGRPFEHACITAGESVGVIEFLMSIENPTDEIIDSVQCAIRWYDKVKMTGYRTEKTKETFKLIKDPEAGTLWARFYDVETSKPFVITDGEKKTFDLNAFHPRMLGYQFFNSYGYDLIEPYKIWAEKFVSEEDRVDVDSWKK